MNVTALKGPRRKSFTLLFQNISAKLKFTRAKAGTNTEQSLDIQLSNVTVQEAIKIFKMMVFSTVIVFHRGYVMSFERLCNLTDSIGIILHLSYV